ncbi:DUF707 domain-containing protein [Catenovulum maritimum]|uniref:DUF707 domain-containing protein n=1 Tax=Catenovulum maritimum TaxID=1513271 RepID=UPI0006601247|nr:DUF707 domain-containing protein [Catenovulum maritimum]
MEVVKSKSSKFLVFTSAGRSANVKQWANGAQFDLFVVDYCNGDSNTKQFANYYLERKGGKFQNIHFCYTQDPDVFSAYDAIMVMDDDILLPADKINELFEFLMKEELSIIQPAFSARGKISHKITKVNPNYQYRLTNFVEVTCPIFKTSELTSFLEFFDPVANGGGVDWWFCYHAESRTNKPCIAVVDSIVCLNPHDVHKGGTREIDRFRSREQRNADWAEVRERNKLSFSENEFKTYEGLGSASVLHHCFCLFDNILAFAGRIQRKIGRTLSS